jgi:hypothetical protein
LQGGIVFYLLKYGDPGYDPDLQHGLIMASVDQSTGIGWGGGAQYISPNYSGLFTGKSNTDAMFAFLGTATPNASAVVKAYRGGGFNDWFLPSSDELEQMVQYSQLINLDLGFVNDYYWSSTEFDIGNAISIRAKIPGYLNSPKSTYHRVRAIRSF